MELAPIILFTFNRLDHTKKTVEALEKNLLASESELFIFSDGPRREDEVKTVREVRNYLATVNKFKKVTVIESKVNKGLATSVIDGITEILNKYDKVIVLEDDLVTSNMFLTYMNNALEVYKNRSDIWSISGYTPDIKFPENFKEESYLIRRGCSWGWGTWSDRWKLNDWSIKDYKEFKSNKEMKENFNSCGSDMAPMLEDQMKGRIDSWAIRWGYNQFRLNKWTVYPRKSFVFNIGMDLSGTHSLRTNKFDVKLSDNDIYLNKDIEINNEVCSAFKELYDLDTLGYIKIVVKKMGLYKPARRLRNKMVKFMVNFNKR